METSPVRYEFGANWNDFSQTITDESINSAVLDLVRLVDELDGKSFFDIGSGSGLHSLAALKLGAKKVMCIDYDNDSVKTTESVLKRYGESEDWFVKRADILQEAPIVEEQYDVVYSWGVLHHTGNMKKAINNALLYVKPGGKLILALYLKTFFCDLWKVEKYVYSKYKWLRPIIKYPYMFLLLMGHLIRGRNIIDFVKSYRDTRGMSFTHDVDDWLGGYPYESISQKELEDCLGGEFRLVKSFNIKQMSGLLGTGCGEWVFVKD